MSERLMSQGMKRLFWDFEEATTAYGRYGGERSALDAAQTRKKLWEAIIALEARNALLEDVPRQPVASHQSESGR